MDDKAHIHTMMNEIAGRTLFHTARFARRTKRLLARRTKKLFRGAGVIQTIPVSEMAQPIHDISKWQSTSEHPFNFDTYAESDSLMLITKMSQGVRIEEYYDYYIDNVIARQIAHGGYHFLDDKANVHDAADLWAEQINALGPHYIAWMRTPSEITRFWVDVEYASFKSNDMYLNSQYLSTFINEVELRTGVRIGIYTSYFSWKDLIGFFSIPNTGERDLWIAHYGTQYPRIPDDWDTWLLWQNCDSCPECGSCGAPYGAASRSIDHDYANKTIQQFFTWITKEGEHMPTPEYNELSHQIGELRGSIEELSATVDAILGSITSLDERITALESGTPVPGYRIPLTVKAPDGLRLRRQPNDTSDIITTMRYGEIVYANTEEVQDEKGRGTWRHVKCGVSVHGDIIGWAAGWWLEQ